MKTVKSSLTQSDKEFLGLLALHQAQRLKGLLDPRSLLKEGTILILPNNTFTTVGEFIKGQTKYCSSQIYEQYISDSLDCLVNVNSLALRNSDDKNIVISTFKTLEGIEDTDEETLHQLSRDTVNEIREAIYG